MSGDAGEASHEYPPRISAQDILSEELYRSRMESENLRNLLRDLEIPVQ